ELYLLRAGQPGRPYRLAFTGHTGPGLNSPRRTVEFFHNRQKFGSDKVINGFARVVSDPFYPKGGVDTLVIRIKEKVAPPARPFGLWHTDLPIEYRKLNLSVSDIELLPPGEPSSQLSLGQAIRGADLFTKSYSFDGIEPNQWVREAMNFSLLRPSEASSLTLSVTAPDVGQLRFPMHLKLTVDRVQTVHTVQQPGTVVLRVPLGGSDICGSVTEVRLEPDQSFSPQGLSSQDRGAEVISRLGWSRLNHLMAEAVKTRSRPVLQSVRLESLKFD
ncbi:MAG: hypothetical protein ACRD2L_21030, partial [Terriglobia bacterium]